MNSRGEPGSRRAPSSSPAEASGLGAALVHRAPVAGRLATVARIDAGSLAGSHAAGTDGQA
jgi:hypothetical protein